MSVYFKSYVYYVNYKDDREFKEIFHFENIKRKSERFHVRSIEWNIGVRGVLEILLIGLYVFFFLRWQSRRVSPLCRLRKVLKIFGLIFWNVLRCTKQDVQSNTMVFYYDIEFTKRKLSWKNIFRSILK